MTVAKATFTIERSNAEELMADVEAVNRVLAERKAERRYYETANEANLAVTASSPGARDRCTV